MDDRNCSLSFRDQVKECSIVECMIRLMKRYRDE